MIYPDSAAEGLLRRTGAETRGTAELAIPDHSAGNAAGIRSNQEHCALLPAGDERAAISGPAMSLRALAEGPHPAVARSARVG